jgi:uncharacterized DUF497 family protein
MVKLKIDDFQFDWDEVKNSENIRKHDIAFNVAATIWSNPEKVLDIADERFDYKEERWIALGPLPDDDSRIIAVAYCDRGPNIRIISSRYAEKQEEIAYRKRMMGR